MFKQRLFTTLILLPLVLIAIYFAPAWLLGLIILALTILCGWEWTKLIAIERLDVKVIYILVLLAMLWLCHYYIGIWLIVGLLGWLLVLLAVVTYPRSQVLWGRPLIVAVAGLLFLALFSNSVMSVFQNDEGQNLFVYVMCLVWATDIGAYIVGKRWGQYKLIPKVSPGKTIEGSIGGIILALLVASIGYLLIKPHCIVVWFLTAILVVLISIVGDLFISMLKRRCGLKDSGHIIPGHGGILDRLDSSIAALPLFYYALSFLEFGH